MSTAEETPNVDKSQSNDLKENESEEELNVVKPKPVMKQIAEYIYTHVRSVE